MTSFKNMFQVAAFSLAIAAAAAVPTKQAEAAGRGDVIAGVVGGVLLGGLLASAAHANQAPVQTFDAPAQTYVAPQQTYQAPVQTYQAPVQTETYYAPAPVYHEPVPQYYAPPVTFSFGISSGHRFGKRRYNGHRFNRRHRRFYGH